MNRIEFTTVRALPSFDGMTPQAIKNYFVAKTGPAPLLKRRVLDPLADLLKAETGFDADNLPAEKTTTSRVYGPVSFEIQSEARLKRPAIKEVFEGLHGYLGHIVESHAKGINRKGVRTFNGEPHVLLSDVTDKIVGLQEDTRTDGVKHSIKHGSSLQYDNSPLMVPLTSRVQLNEAGAVLYANASKLYGHFQDNVIRPAKKCLEKQTGYSKSNVPSEMTEMALQLNNHLVVVQAIPENNVSYSSAVSALVKEAPSRMTSRSRVGDLTRLSQSLEMDPAIQGQYAPRTRGGQTYVSVGGMLNRMYELKEANTNPSLNFRIQHFPGVSG